LLPFRLAVAQAAGAADGANLAKRHILDLGGAGLEGATIGGLMIGNGRRAGTDIYLGLPTLLLLRSTRQQGKEQKCN